MSVENQHIKRPHFVPYEQNSVIHLQGNNGFYKRQGHIKLIFTVITAQAIKPKAVQIKKQHRTLERIS